MHALYVWLRIICVGRFCVYLTHKCVVCGTPDFITGEEKSMVLSKQPRKSLFMTWLLSLAITQVCLTQCVAGHTLW